MAIYRAYQPTLVASYVISILVKSLWLKNYPNLQLNSSTMEKTPHDVYKERTFGSRISMESCLEDTFGNQYKTANICHSYCEDDKSEEVSH